jgi:hypothetical protein
MYRRIRLRLTLLYASVLAVVLLVASGLLYFSMWQTVMGPVNSGLANVASSYATAWQQSGMQPCIPHTRPDDGGGGILFVACYNSTGTGLLGFQGLVNQAPGFLDPSLAQRALKDTSSSDVVDGGSTNGGYDLGVTRWSCAISIRIKYSASFK